MPPLQTLRAASARQQLSHWIDHEGNIIIIFFNIFFLGLAFRRMSRNQYWFLLILHQKSVESYRARKLELIKSDLEKVANTEIWQQNTQQNKRNILYFHRIADIAWVFPPTLLKCCIQNHKIKRSFQLISTEFVSLPQSVVILCNLSLPSFFEEINHPKHFSLRKYWDFVDRNNFVLYLKLWQNIGL